MEIEEDFWMDSPYEGYQVHPSGMVRTVDRFISNGKARVLKRGQLLKAHLTNVGYRDVSIYYEGKRVHKTVHRLVAETFLENVEGKREVNHMNGDILDNDVTNLEWVTPSENVQHAYRTGLKAKGESHVLAKLTDSEVLSIREEYLEGAIAADLARKYEVDNGTISKFLRGAMRKDICTSDIRRVKGKRPY